MKQVSPLWLLWSELMYKGVINWRTVRIRYGNKKARSSVEALLFGIPGSESGTALKSAVIEARVKTLYHHPKISKENALSLIGADYLEGRIPTKPTDTEQAVASEIVSQIIEIQGSP